jgi:hypothetical protein
VAKHCERQENDYAAALDLTLQAPALRDCADLRKAKRDYTRGWRTFDAR